MKLKGYIYAGAIVVIAILLSYVLGCNHGKGLACPPNKDTAAVKHDTVYTYIKQDTQYIPHLDTVLHEIPVPIYSTDTLYLEQLVDTGAILKDYFARRYYVDSQKVFAGYIVIKDTVSQNKIVSRQLISSFKIPHDSTTIILHQPKRSFPYLGFGVIGNNDGGILKGVSVSVGLKTRKDYIYEISASAIQNNKPLYQGWFKIPIRINKK